MFSLEGENSDEDLDFTPMIKTGSGLGNVFVTHQQSHTASNNSQLTYKPPKQPNRGIAGEDREPINVEIKQIKEKNSEESFEPMSNIRPGVKMATAVSAYKFENNGFESLGKLGLAIIGKKESNCYQLLLYKGKQNPVAIANISPTLKLNVQPDNYTNFVDERGISFTVCFESQDVLINFAKQVLLCKTTFKMSGIFCCDLSLGEGKDVEMGDSLEVQMTSWTVENQSIGQMVETTRNKEKGMRFKVGGKNFFKGLEAGILGMKKGGRRFVIADLEHGMKAYDVEVTKLKSSEEERRTSLNNNNNLPDDKTDDLVQRMARIGQPMMQNMKKNSIDMSQEMPELEEVHPKYALSSEVRRNSGHKHPPSETGFTTIPITDMRSETPMSEKSGTSEVFRNIKQTEPNIQSGVVYSQGSEFNMLMSETRMQNTEMRMNLQRVGDKVDSLLTLQSGERRMSHGETKVTNEDIMRKLQEMAKPNDELKDLIKNRRGSNIEDEEYIQKQQKLNEQTEMLKRLEETLREKEQQLGKVMKSQNEKINILEEKLEEQSQIIEKSHQTMKTQLKSEVKKVMNSTAKLLMSQFQPEESFTGQKVQETVGQTVRLIYEKLEEKYAAKEKVEKRKEPPVAAVAPVPAEVEEWEAESEEEN